MNKPDRRIGPSELAGIWRRDHIAVKSCYRKEPVLRLYPKSYL